MNSVESIKQYLRQQARLYYQSGTSEIPDDAYDRLSELVSLYEVGYQDSDLDCKHIQQLFSLKKVFQGRDSVPSLFTSTKPTVTTLKLDGACIAAVYEYGMLAKVITRGDGVMGKDITSKFIGSDPPIPLHIDTYNRYVQIVLEVVSNETDNPRNYCAGALNLKSVEEFRTRKLTYIAHGLRPMTVTGTYQEDMDWVAQQGFLTIFSPICKSFPSDGEVVRFSNNSDYLEAGNTSDAPRGAYAKKVMKAGVHTKLLSVEWQLGKSGKVTPVAILEPINIGGAIVSRASLHNVGFIESLDISIGDVLEVIRSGEIIPYIVGKVS